MKSVCPELANPNCLRKKEKSLLCVGGTVQEEWLGLDGSLIAKLATDPIQERSDSHSTNAITLFFILQLSHNCVDKDKKGRIYVLDMR